MKRFKLIKLLCFGYAFIALTLVVCAMGTKLYADSTMYSNTKKYTYTVSVANPLCVEDIMANIGLTATDNGVDLTDSITYVDCDDYINKVYNVPVESARTLGEYCLNFRVIDASSAVGTCKIYVNVIDDTAPIIDKNMSILSWTFEKGEICSNMYNIIQNGISAHDGYSVKNITYSFEAKTITTSSPAGNYTLKVNVSDPAGNVASTNVTVIVTDEIMPYFVCDTGYVEANQGDHPLLNEISLEFNVSAYDSNGNKLTARLDNKEDLPEMFTEPGLYTFEYVTEDENGNSSFISLYFYLIDETPPVFYLDYTDLVVVKGALYDLDRIDGIIRMRSKRSDFTYEVVEDNYTLNKDEVGEYSYKINVNYNDGTEEEMDFIIKVIEKTQQVIEEENIELPDGFFNKVKFIALKLFEIVIRIVKWPMKKLASLF